MNKKLLPLALLFLPFLIGCSSSDEPTPPDPETENYSWIKSPNEAALLALEARKNFFPDSIESRSSQISECVVIPITEKFGSRNSTSSPAVLYAVNFPDEDGFALINAFNWGPQVIGVSDCGRYEDKETGNNPEGLDLYISSALKSISKSKVLNPIDTISDKFERMVMVMDTIVHEEIPAKITAKWSQNPFFGAYCPNQKTGCGPLALGMTLSYFGFPNSIDLNFQNAPTDNIILPHQRFNKLTDTSVTGLHRDSHGYNDKELIGMYLRQLGAHCNAVYFNDGKGTGASVYAVREAASQLCANSDLTVTGFTLSDSFTPLDRDVRDGIVLMNGAVNETGLAHMWIVDGYIHSHIIKTTYAVSLTGGKRVVMVNDDDVHYMHINWGFGGKSNGYFLYGSEVGPSITNKHLDANTDEYDINIVFDSHFYYFTVKREANNAN